jgi:glutaredoxin
MVSKNKKITLSVIISILILIAGYAFFSNSKKNLATTAAKVSEAGLDIFSQCLQDSGAKFYGASWCPHCKEQKELLNNSKNMPYVECAIPNSNEQVPICGMNKIESYPTWVFADGSRESGALSLEILSQKTSCQIPQ